MKKWTKYLISFTIFFAISMALTIYFNNNKVNASFSNDPKLIDEELIIIDNNTKKNNEKDKNQYNKKIRKN